MKNYLLTLFFMLNYFAFSQECNECNEKDKMINPDSHYEGCIDFGVPNGKGLLVETETNNVIYDGCWLDGKYNGKGFELLRYKHNNNIKLDEYGYYNGLIYRESISREGIFENGNLKDGFEIITYTNGFKETTKYIDTYKDVRGTIKNYENNRNIDDIIGGSKTTVDIRAIGNQYYLKIGFINGQGTIQFDSGGSVLTIGKDLWDKFIDQGIQENIHYEELNLWSKFGSAIDGQFEYNRAIKIFELVLGDYVIRNVVAYLSPSDSSLMGADFFKKFSEVKWSLTKNQLEFYK